MDAPRRPSAYSYRSDPAVPAFPDDRPLIIFDGFCVLCSRFARFLLKHDRERRLRFAAAQSPLGTALYAHYGRAPGDYETHLLIENGEAMFKSDAGLRVLSLLGAPWSIATIARVLPERWRDALYDRLARNRISWFGARDVCFAPDRSDVDRFLG